jgi:tetratricopeptide (TPR) repeat protein
MFRGHRRPLAFLALALAFATPRHAPTQERSDYPPEARRRYEEGVELQARGKYQEALQAYDDAIRLGLQAYPRVHLKRATSQLDLKQYDKAIAEYTRFLEQFSLEESCRY